MIEKSENDDRLIAMLKDEVKRIESQKNVKGSLITGSKMATTDEVISLRGENGRLRNQVKCQEVDLAMTKEKLQQL